MKRIVIILGLYFTFSTVFAQEVESSEEQLDSANFSALLKAYNSVIQVHEEELTLIKVDLLGPLLYSMSNNEEGVDSVQSNFLGLAIERKFKPDWSWIVSTTLKGDKKDVRKMTFAGGVRHYYNINRRILSGKSANNFSSNYVSATLSTAIRPAIDEHQISINLLYGIQRRIGRFGFVDWNIGFQNIVVPYSYQSVGVDLTTRITIGIGI